LNNNCNKEAVNETDSEKKNSSRTKQNNAMGRQASDNICLTGITDGIRAAGRQRTECLLNSELLKYTLATPLSFSLLNV